MKKTISILTCFVLASCFSNSHAQNINAGMGFGRNALTMQSIQFQKKFQGFNSFSLFGEFQKQSFIIGLSSEINFLPVLFNKRTTIDYDYNHGHQDGQYNETTTYEIFRYESKMPSMYAAVNFGYIVKPEKQCSVVFGLNIERSFALKQKITKDSLTTVINDIHSNPPAGEYYHNITYTYGNSSNTDLAINKSNYFISPSLALRIKIFKEKFHCEIKGGLNIHVSPIYSITFSGESSQDVLFASRFWYANFLVAYKFKKIPQNKIRKQDPLEEKKKNKLIKLRK